MVNSDKLGCSICGKLFSSKQNLSRHGKTHDVERRHTCTICAKSFTRSDLLKRHTRTHEIESDISMDGPSPNKRARLQSDTPASIESQPLLARYPDQLNLQPPDMAPFEWSNWERGGVLSYDQHEQPFDEYLVDASPWQSLFPDHCLEELPDIWGGFPEIRPMTEHPHILRPDGEASGSQDHILSDTAQSPPNEASHEDQTPFAWNPSSRRISNDIDVVLEVVDPLLKDLDPHFTVNADTYQKLCIELTQDIEFRGTVVGRGLRKFPSLTVINAFLTRFSRCFLPQAPVLHIPTLNIDQDCPTYMLAIMISIGATYCRRRHARRFAIALQDLARCHLRLAVDACDALLKDPMMVYGAALICYAGIWCGNKRAFELAEALRGSVVTWARRLPTHPRPGTLQANHNNGAHDIWRAWVRQESLQRLLWTVYIMDCQASSLISINPCMSLIEVFDWDCPCDDEYWTAPSPRQLKLLLGNAVVPPTRAFGAALGPFLQSNSVLRPLTHLNSHSAFLVLLTINMEILRFAEARDISFKLSHMTYDENDKLSLAAVPQAHGDLKKHFVGSLALWQQMYAAEKPSNCPSSMYFQSASRIVLELSHLQMQVSVHDLQGIIGRFGEDGIQQAMCRSAFCTTNMADHVHALVKKLLISIELHHSCLLRVLKAKDDIPEGEQFPNWTASTLTPYSAIYLFLGHVFLYSCTATMNTYQKQRLLSSLQELPDYDGPCQIRSLFMAGLSEDGDSSACKAVLREAAKTLAMNDTWGCSANLALLLHWRSRLN